MNVKKLIVVMLLLAGCQSPTFSRVDFKYSNLAHMELKDAVVKVGAEPQDLIFALSNAFSAQGNYVIERSQLDYYYKFHSKSDACWKANYEIYQKEFHTFTLNNYSIYHRIDRAGVFDSYGVSEQCTFFDMVSDNSSKSWFLKVEIPQGNFQSTISVPTVESFFAYSLNGNVSGTTTTYQNQVINTKFSSMLYIWAWKESPSSETLVYLFSKPVNEQVESCNGCSIGHNWWKQANGYAEYKIVKHYKYLLESLDEKAILQKN